MAPKLENFVQDQVTATDTEEAVRAYYESADIADIHTELETNGINPTSTIANVKSLVAQSKRARDPQRR